MKTYAAYYENEIRKESSSGGLFSAIASQFDVVYGVAMSDDCYEAIFQRIEDDDIASIRGSKYLQARVGDTFKSVKKDLLEGKTVFFTGTGCQINGLKYFLQNEYSNLVLLDVVCHGVPSPMLWRKYVLYQEEKYNKLTSVNFRCKDDSWKDFGMKENHIFISKDRDAYMRMFLRNYCLRPSCYECHAKDFKNADITIGDFWGIEDAAPEMNDGKGTSLVVVRTEKGQELFNAVKKELKWKEVPYEEGVKRNSSEFRSPDMPSQRDVFFDDLNSLPFLEVEKKYASGFKVPSLKKIIRKAKTCAKKRSLKIDNVKYGTLYTFKSKSGNHKYVKPVLEGMRRRYEREINTDII